MLAHLHTPRLILSLCPSAASRKTMTTGRSRRQQQRWARVRDECATAREVTRSDQDRVPERPVSCLLCYTYHCTYNHTCFPPRLEWAALHSARQKRRRVCCSCHLSIAVGARHDLPTDCLPDCGCHAVCPCPAALLLTCPIRAVSFILQGRG